MSLNTNSATSHFFEEFVKFGFMNFRFEEKITVQKTEN
jgi:hypothetical protein